MSSLDLSPPESPSTNSLYHATSTMDDITTALANFSRVPSPEPLSAVTCCCGKENCENLKSWLAIKSRLGSRLTLSAGRVNIIHYTLLQVQLTYYVFLEVGQALLQRHEAYVRQHEVYDPSKSNRSFLLSDLNLNPTQRKWGSINASHYPQEDNTTTDSQSMNDDLNSELETLTMEKVRLEKVSIDVIAGSLCHHTSPLSIAIESSFSQL